MVRQKSPTRLLTDAQLKQWEDDGYLLLRGVIPLAAIEGVKKTFARQVDNLIKQLKDEGLITDEGKELPFETRFAQVAGKLANKFGRGWRKAIASPELYELQNTPKLVDAMADLLGPEVRGHAIWNARPKLPGQQLTIVPWHQDSSYFGQESITSRIMTVWVPLVSIDASMGAMQVLPGTHKGGLVEHRTEELEGKFLEIVGEVDESRAVTCDMEPGDALVFGNLLYHRSLATVGKTIRWSVDIRYYPEGDSPGAPGTSWTNPADKWVIRSAAEPVTGVKDWLRMASELVW